MSVPTLLRKFVLPLAVVAAAAGVMVLLSSMKKGQRRAPPRPFVRTVDTRPVVYASVRPALTAMGRVRAESRVGIAPEVGGMVRRDGFRLRKGMSFEQGQVLLRIDSRQALYSYQTTVSDLRNALTGLLAELAVDHPEAHGRWHAFFTELEGTRLPAIPETSDSREKLLATRYNVFKLYYAARSHLVTLAKHTIRAPFTGTVEASSVFPSSMARAGVQIATVVRTDRMEIELALSQHQARSVERGMAVEVRTDGMSRPAPGTVHRIGEVLDERMQTVPVFVRVDSARPYELRAGAYATVHLRGAPMDGAMAIPRTALHERNRVYVIVDGALQERTVRLGTVGVETAYITGGIDEGVELVTQPLQDAVVGMLVRSASSPNGNPASTRKAEGGPGSRPATGRGSGS